MACGMCESHINDAVRREFNVKKVSSSRSKRETVIIADEPIGEDRIREVITAAGYGVTSVKTEEFEKSGLFGGLFKK